MGNDQNTLLVIGGSSDIGRRLIADSADRYDAVIAHSFRSADKLDELALSLGGNMHAVVADLSDENEVVTLAERILNDFGAPSHIVFLASPKLSLERFEKSAWNAYETALNVSLRASFHLLKAFLPIMAKRRRGKVVFVLTTHTERVTQKYITAYVSAKYALLGFMRSLALEYRDRGIMMNAVSPDTVDTGFIAAIPRLAMEQYAQTRPNQRLLSVGEVVPAIEFLLSPGGDAVTGQNIVIDGGAVDERT